MQHDTETAGRDERSMPFQLDQPAGMLDDLVDLDALPRDEREWVPQTEDVWFRPLCLSRSQGYWVNLLRVRRSGILTRDRHPAPVHGFVLRGHWHYLEHDWVATEGSYVFEPPGETHTLVVPDDCDEMITMFHITGAMIYVDPWGNTTGFEDVFSKIELCRRHYEAVGLDPGLLDRVIR